MVVEISGRDSLMSSIGYIYLMLIFCCVIVVLLLCYCCVIVVLLLCYCCVIVVGGVFQEKWDDDV